MQSTLLQSWGDSWPQVRITKPLKTGEGVIDEAAFKTIEVDELFDKLNYAQTTVGQAVLYRSLTQPLDSLSEINAKQEALKELEKNPELKQRLVRILQNAVAGEQTFYTLLFADFLGALGIVKSSQQIEGYGYQQYKKGVRFLLELVDEINALDLPSSPYLRILFEKIIAFSNSRSYALMAGPVYISERGIQSKSERAGNFSPAIIFKPTIFKPILIALCFAFVWLLLHFFPTDMFKFSAEATPVASVFFIPLLLIYFPIVGGYDRDNCIIPLRNEFRQAQEVGKVLDALGQLDELLSFITYAENFASPCVLPEMVEAEHHQIMLTEAKNPILAKANPEYVGNNFTLQEQKLAFITGPNSGGKTAFCKTIAQIQLLAQIGCYVPAKSAVLAIADRIFYQAPEISHLDDGEGRFGTELKRTRDIFLATTAKSLVILDELSEGTTFEEKLESSTNVLDGFYRKGNNTLLITHNHQLVDSFAKKRQGLTLQTEFANDAPTYRLTPGISRVSHADRVAKKIGFSKQDIDNYLAQKK
jgi:energy-coupling factor transporter ATP-binding protein EcfA2